LAFRHFPQGLSKAYLQFYIFFIPRYLRKARKVGTVSEFVKKDITSFLNIGNKVFVAPNALPTMAMNITEPKVEKIIPQPYFIYVGSIHPRKNIKRTIEAFMLFNQKVNDTCNLVLLGRNAWGNTELKDLLLNKNIIHVENADDHQKYEYIKNSEGLLYISLNEGFGIPVLEGFACGVPVITSNLSSMPEVAGDAAILVDPTSVYEISEAMKELFENKEKSLALKEKGTKRLEEFNWEHTGKIIYQQFIQIKAL
jgi:glycosyltransferase involved in cell wall biosynthesis